MSRAVIYVRVSSSDQVNGFSLDVQERVCRDFAERNGWAVGLVVREEGESAKTMDRRELQKLLARLGRPGHGFTHFLVYDVSRFTRDTADYFTLKGFLAGAGVVFVAVTQPMDESPSGRFMGTILAAAGQFDNDVRREKTVAGMREAIKRGIWPWKAPLGYLSLRGPDRKPTMVEDPDAAPFVRLAFEQIAAGACTQEEARAELRKRGLDVPRETFSRLVHNPIYCGRIVAPAWGLEAVGAFRPIVSPETWRRAQAALQGAPDGWRRSDLRPEFPLRWWTRCGACARPLTGSFCKGRRERFAYYRCMGCGHSVPRDRVHDAFGTLLDSLACPSGLWYLWEAVMREAWGQRADLHKTQQDAARRRSRTLDEREERVISALLDGHLDAPTVKRMRAKVAQERSELAESTPLPLPDFEHALRIGRRLAESPRVTWDALSLDARPRFLRIAFPARLDYEVGTGFRTPAKSLYLSSLSGANRSSCEPWYPQRDVVQTTDITEVVPGWIAAGGYVEERWQP